MFSWSSRTCTHTNIQSSSEELLNKTVLNQKKKKKGKGRDRKRGREGGRAIWGEGVERMDKERNCISDDGHE